MPAVCRVGDRHACGDIDASGSENVMVNGSPAHRLADRHTHGAAQIQASPNVLVNGLGIARVGDDQGADSLGHEPNPQATGSSDVFANDGA